MVLEVYWSVCKANMRVLTWARVGEMAGDLLCVACFGIICIGFVAVYAMQTCMYPVSNLGLHVQMDAWPTALQDTQVTCHAMCRI